MANDHAEHCIAMVNHRMRKRRWKIFQIGSRDEIGRLQSVAQNFGAHSHTLRIERYVGGGYIESDMPISYLRTLFRSAGVFPFPDFVTQDTDPALDEATDL